MARPGSFLVEASLLLGADQPSATMHALLAPQGFALKPLARAHLLGNGMTRATLVWRCRQVGRCSTFTTVFRMAELSCASAPNASCASAPNAS